MVWEREPRRSIVHVHDLRAQFAKSVCLLSVERCQEGFVRVLSLSAFNVNVSEPLESIAVMYVYVRT